MTSAGLETLYLVYGVLSSFSINLIMLVTLTMPATWFPQHRGKVIGFVNSGFGLSSTGGQQTFC